MSRTCDNDGATRQTRKNRQDTESQALAEEGADEQKLPKLSDLKLIMAGCDVGGATAPMNTASSSTETWTPAFGSLPAIAASGEPSSGRDNSLDTFGVAESNASAGSVYEDVPVQEAAAAPSEDGGELLDQPGRSSANSQSVIYPRNDCIADLRPYLRIAGLLDERGEGGSSANSHIIIPRTDCIADLRPYMRDAGLLDERGEDPAGVGGGSPTNSSESAGEGDGDQSWEPYVGRVNCMRDLTPFIEEAMRYEKRLERRRRRVERRAVERRTRLESAEDGRPQISIEEEADMVSLSSGSHASDDGAAAAYVDTYAQEVESSRADTTRSDFSVDVRDRAPEDPGEMGVAGGDVASDSEDEVRSDGPRDTDQENGGWLTAAAANPAVDADDEYESESEDEIVDPEEYLGHAHAGLAGALADRQRGFQVLPPLEPPPGRRGRNGGFAARMVGGVLRAGARVLTRQ